jgi:superfamily II DNA/RNA helicase
MFRANGPNEAFDRPHSRANLCRSYPARIKPGAIVIRGAMSFSHLGLSDKVLSAVTAAGYTTPTPIQDQAIPHVLARRDVLGIAQTGTGKTAAFVLPMLTMLETGRARARMPRTLILEPTRELAAQVEESFIKYGTNHKLNVALLIGGVSFDDQDSKLTRGVDVLIATPGRLLDHHERGRLLMTGVELLVIDEADRMLDMGFIPDIERICKLVPFTRQTLFFTATMPPEIRRITEQFLHNPVKVEVSRPASTVSTTSQQLVKTGRESHDKRDTLRRLIRAADGLKNAIVFCNRKREVALLHHSLLRHGFSAVALHGDMDQSARMAALDQFRRGEVKLLIASDVAARGLDIPDVSHVFNFDVPHHPDDYVHRIGRTGRAGRSGAAITIVAPSDQKSVGAIEKLIGQSIPWAGDPPAAEDAEAPRQRGDRERGRHARGRGRDGSRDNGSREGKDSKVARLDPAVPRPAAKPRPAEPRPPRAEPSDGEHLPAFLLRPVRVKA